MNPPNIAYLLPTGRCNLSCGGCYATLENCGRHSKTKELTIAQYRAIIADLLRWGVRTFDISGGEPFLYPHLIELCETIRSCADARIWLVSNGTVARPDQLRTLSTLVERFVISLDAPDATLHDQFRGLNGAFSAAVATLRAARRLPFHEIGVNQLFCGQNAQLVTRMIGFCRSEMVDRLALLSYRDVSENGVMPEMIPLLPDFCATWEAVAGELDGNHYPRVVDLVIPSFLFRESRQFHRRLPAGLRERINLHHPHLRGLSAYQRTLVVKPYGMLTGDTAMVNSAFFDLQPTEQGVRKDWEREAPGWRRKLALRERRLRDQAPCRTCPRWATCRGGCPAAALHQSGSFWTHDRSCDRFRDAACF
jgi:radical SAM protein with 4Fe4S-binding SPASM domain